MKRTAVGSTEDAKKMKLSLPTSFWLSGASRPLVGDLQLSVEPEGAEQPVTFDVDQFVVIGASPYLGALIANAKREGKPVKVVRLPWKLVTPRSLANVVKVLYGDLIEVGDENALELHSASNFLQIDRLSQACLRFIMSLAPLVSFPELLSFWAYSRQSFAGAEGLHGVCEKTIAGRLALMQPCDPAWLALDWEAVSTIFGFLDVAGEVASPLKSHGKLDAVLHWLNHDFGNRHAHAQDAMAFITWEQVDFSIVGDLQSIKDFHARDCQSDGEKLTEHYIMKLLSRNWKTPVQDPMILEKAERTSAVYCIRAGGTAGDGYKCKIFNVSESRWSAESDLLSPENEGSVIHAAFQFNNRPFIVLHSGESVAVHEVSQDGKAIYPARGRLVSLNRLNPKKLLVTGGGNGWVCFAQTVPAKVSVYDISSVVGDDANGSNREISCSFTINIFDKSYPVQSFFTISVIQDHLFIFGGQDWRFRYTWRTRLLDLKARTWETSPRLLYEVTHPSVTVHRGSLFVTGGLCGGSAVTSAFRFDLADRKWHLLPPMLKARTGHCLAMVGQSLFAFGGFSGAGVGKGAGELEYSGSGDPLVPLAEPQADLLDLCPLEDRWFSEESFEEVSADFAVSV